MSHVIPSSSVFGTTMFWMPSIVDVWLFYSRVFIFYHIHCSMFLMLVFLCVCILCAASCVINDDDYYYYCYSRTDHIGYLLGQRVRHQYVKSCMHGQKWDKCLLINELYAYTPESGVTHLFHASWRSVGYLTLSFVWSRTTTSVDGVENNGTLDSVAAKANLMHFSIKMWHFAATFQSIFLTINWKNLMQFKQ